MEWNKKPIDIPFVMYVMAMPITFISMALFIGLGIHNYLVPESFNFYNVKAAFGSLLLLIFKVPYLANKPAALFQILIGIGINCIGIVFMMLGYYKKKKLEKNKNKIKNKK